jgi:hypothetical protein
VDERGGFEFAVGAGDGAGGEAEVGGDLADGGEAFVLGEPAGGDEGGELGTDLLVRGYGAGGVHLDVHRRVARGEAMLTRRQGTVTSEISARDAGRGRSVSALSSDMGILTACIK